MFENVHAVWVGVGTTWRMITSLDCPGWSVHETNNISGDMSWGFKLGLVSVAVEQPECVVGRHRAYQPSLK